MPITVLDSSSINGLLQMAYEDGLLQDRQDFGDRFLYGLSRRPLAEWHRQQILEQIILNSQLYGINQVPLDWLEGDFLQRGILKWGKIEGGLKDEGIQIAPEIIDGLLRAKGQNIPIQEYESRFEATRAVLDKIEAYIEKHPKAEFDREKIFARGLLDEKFSHSRAFTLERELEEVWSKLSPLSEAVKEFIRLSNFAGTNGSNLKTPVYLESPNLINLFPSKELEGDSIQVFRFATNQLGSLPFLSTLKDTLQLANAPETRALREQVDNWSRSIDRGTASATASIQKDIKKANESLKRSTKIRKAGFITGVVAIPVSMVGMLIPFLGAVGLTLSCVAVICEVSGVKKAEKVKWVGFGSRRDP